MTKGLRFIYMLLGSLVIVGAAIVALAWLAFAVWAAIAGPSQP